MTKNGKKINVEPYVERMISNLRLGRDIREQTPIGQKADGNFFWWDEDKNPTLDKRSVRDMIKAVKQIVATEERE